MTAVIGDPAHADDAVDGMIDQRAQQFFAVPHLALRILDVTDVTKHQHATVLRARPARCNRRNLQMQEATGIGHHLLRHAGFQRRVYFRHVFAEHAVE